MKTTKLASLQNCCLASVLILSLTAIFSLSFPAVAGSQGGVVDIEFNPGTGAIEVGGESQGLGEFCDGESLLGIFPPWNRGLDCNDRDLDLSEELADHKAEKSRTNIIITNVTSILIRAAGLIAAIALIVAGFKYTLSHGNSQKASGALKSVIHALSGLALAVAATLIVDSIHHRLVGESADLDRQLPGVIDKPDSFVSNTIGLVMLIIGLISVLMIVLQGMRYALSRGNAEKTAAARNGIIYSLVGVVVALTSWSFVEFVLGRLILSGDTTGGAGISNLMGSIIGILVFIVGVISVIMVIVGGYQYIFSGGDAQKASSARGTIIYSLIGVTLAIAAGPILAWILQRI